MMVADRFEPPVATIAQHAKDVGPMLELGRRSGQQLPLSELHRDLLADQPNVLPAGGGTFTRYDLLNIAIPVAAEDAATQGEPPPVLAAPAPRPPARHPRTESVAAIVAQTKS